MIDDAHRLLGDRAALRLERARIETARGGPLAVKKVEELAQGLERFSSEERRLLLAGLASELFRLGSTGTARRLWIALADQEPNDVTVRLILLDLAIEAEDEAAMKRLREEFRRHEGEDGPFHRYAAARHLVWRAGKGDRTAAAKARAILNALAEHRPEWSLVPLAVAELDEIEHDRNGAVKAYLRAIDLGERNPQVIRRAARLLLASRRFADTDRLLRLLPESELIADNLLPMAAEVAMHAADYPRGLELSRKAVSARPGEFSEHLRLGEALWALGDVAEAEVEFRRAVVLGSTATQSWVALVGLLDRTGQIEKAESVIREIEVVVPSEHKVLIMSRCLDTLGKLEQAQALYQAMLASRPDDLDTHRALAALLLRRGAFHEAEARLRKLNASNYLGVEFATWSRRTLAMALTFEGSYPAVREAFGLVNKREDPEDFLALVHVMVAMKSPTRSKEAILMLEQLASGEHLKADDRFLLAQLYEADGAWMKALECLRELLASQPGSTIYLAQMATLAMRNGRTEEARLLTAHLERLVPESLRVIEVKVTLLATQGRVSEAVSLVESFVHDRNGEFGRWALLLEELGCPAEAEVLYRRAIESTSKIPSGLALADVKAILELAGFLGRRDRTAEALDFCDYAWKQGHPDRVAKASVNILAGSSGDDHLTTRVSSRLEEAVAEGEQAASSGVLAGLAAIREMQGRCPEAEALYRLSVTRNDHDPGPINNLACLMSLKNGKSPAALEMINSAIARFGPDPELLDTRAVVHLTNGRPDLACDDLNEAIIVSPSATKYFHRAQAYLRAGRRDDALSDIKMMNKNMDRESRRQIDQEERFAAAGHHASPLNELRKLESSQSEVKLLRR